MKPTLRRRRFALGLALTVLAVALACAAVVPSAFAAGVTCSLSRTSVIYGGQVTVSGVVDPVTEGASPVPLEGLEVAVAVAGVDVATVVTDAAGAYGLTFTPAAGGAVTARLVSDGTVSDPVALTVRPAVTIAHGTPLPFLRTLFTLRVAPATYAGRVVVQVWHRGRRVATLRGTVADGRLSIKVPLRGIEWFSVRFAFGASNGLGTREVKHSVNVEWRRLAVGSKGPRVQGVLRRMVALRIRVPGVGDSFTSAVADAVMAFQKTYRLPRTYVVDYDDWRRLESASRPKPRYTTPATHIEIDETRQILAVVKDGLVLGVVPVSTGATGNTPEGSFSILRKIYVSSTYDGSIPLPRFMTFYKTMGMHGYPDVPPYPASHGCVREPLWACDWVYDRSFVGERVYLFF